MFSVEEDMRKFAFFGVFKIVWLGVIVSEVTMAFLGIFI